MNRFKRAACGALAAALLLTTGCAQNGAPWAYRAGDVQLPVGVYIYYMLNASSAAETKLTELHEGEEGYTVPAYKQMLKEDIDGQTGDAFIRAEAEQSAKEHIAVEQKFAEKGLELTESELSYAKSSATGTWDGNQEFFNENGIAESSIRLIYENSLKTEKLFQETYGEGGERAATDEELQAHFAENYSKVDLMVFTKDFSGESGEDVEETQAKAEGYLKRLQEGEDMYDLIYEQMLDGAEDPATVQQPVAGSQSIVFYDAIRGSYYSDQLIDAALAAKLGEPVMTEDSVYYYILRRIETTETDFMTYRSNLLNELKGDEFDEIVEGWAAAVSAETNQSAVSKYSPSSLKVEA